MVYVVMTEVRDSTDTLQIFIFTKGHFVFHQNVTVKAFIANQSYFARDFQALPIMLWDIGFYANKLLDCYHSYKSSTSHKNIGAKITAKMHCDALFHKGSK